MGPGLSTANAKSKNRFLLVLQLKLILGPICALYFYCPISCLVNPLNTIGRKTGHNTQSATDTSDGALLACVILPGHMKISRRNAITML